MRPNDRTALLAMSAAEALAQPLAPGAFGLPTSHIHESQFNNRNVSRETPSRETLAAAEADMRRRQEARRLAALAGPARTGGLHPSLPAPSLTLYHGAALFSLRYPQEPDPIGGGLRGAVKPYITSAARRRFMRFMASIDMTRVSALPLFITLTYPGEYNANPEQWKTDLRRFIGRLVYRFPSASGVWRLEPQQRGAPHYHLLVFNQNYIHHGWVATEWSDVVAQGYTKYVYLHTRIERVHSYNGVLAYAAKYMAKRSEGDKPLDWGRWWGIFNRPQLPITPITCTLTPQQFFTLKRTARRLLEHQGCTLRAPRRVEGLSVFIHYNSGARLVANVCDNTSDTTGLLEARLALHQARNSRDEKPLPLSMLRSESTTTTPASQETPG